MKQTAVDWLVFQLQQTRDWQRVINEVNQSSSMVRDVVAEAKEMEKEKHQETWNVAHQAGRFEGKGIAEENWQTFEEYWDETFKKQEQ